MQEKVKMKVKMKALQEIRNWHGRNTISKKPSHERERKIWFLHCRSFNFRKKSSHFLDTDLSRLTPPENMILMSVTREFGRSPFAKKTFRVVKEKVNLP